MTQQTGKAKEISLAEPKIGDRMPDGTIFAGISPDTNKPMYATPADASLTMTFNNAQKFAAKLDAHGHQGLARAFKGGAERDVQQPRGGW